MKLVFFYFKNMWVSYCCFPRLFFYLILPTGNRWSLVARSLSPPFLPSLRPVFPSRKLPLLLRSSHGVEPMPLLSCDSLCAGVCAGIGLSSHQFFFGLEKSPSFPPALFPLSSSAFLFGKRLPRVLFWAYFSTYSFCLMSPILSKKPLVGPYIIPARIFSAHFQFCQNIFQCIISYKRFRIPPPVSSFFIWPAGGGGVLVKKYTPTYLRERAFVCVSVCECLFYGPVALHRCCSKCALRPLGSSA